MNDELNLITSEEKFEQRTSLIFKILNILFITLFVVVLGFTIYSYNEFNKLLEVENALKAQKESLLNETVQYDTEQRLMRDLTHRYASFKKFSGEIEDFSEILREIYARSLGLNIEIMTITFSYEEKEAAIRVKSSSEQFTRFVNNLKNTNYRGEGTVYPDLFFPSNKNEEVDQAIREYIVYIKYNPEVLKK